LFLATLCLCGQVLAQEADVKKRLLERIPNFPTISSVSKTNYKGIYEIVTAEPEIFYTDEQATYLMRGALVDLKTKKNLTEDRMEALLTVPFTSLPVKDAFVIVRGDGKRKLAVFEDPNCGYCKRFEADLQKINNVTVYLFLYPILGPDSNEKSKNIWCAKDKAKAWQDWMLRSDPPETASCDVAALTRNVEFGKKHKITGTPTIIFGNGSRIPGAIPADQLEQLLKTRS
jgi:thiol:disulfide interchange protein DsbC